MTLDEVVKAYGDEHPGCHDPWIVVDACMDHSEAFAWACIDAGLEDVEIVSGVHFDGESRIILAGHFATRVGDTVYDWTLRQFYPDAAVPTITPYAEWREDWKPLKEDA